MAEGEKNQFENPSKAIRLYFKTRNCECRGASYGEKSRHKKDRLW